MKALALLSTQPVQKPLQSLFHTRKLRLRDGRHLAQGHTASQCWAWDWTPSLGPEAHGMIFQIQLDFPMGWGTCPQVSPRPPLLPGKAGRSRQGLSHGRPHCCVSTVAPWAVSSNCPFFLVAVKRPPSAKKGECYVVFFVLLFCVSSFPGVSAGYWGWGCHGDMGPDSQPLRGHSLSCRPGGLVGPPLSSDISSRWLEGPCPNRAFVSCFFFYRKGVLVLPDDLMPKFRGVRDGGLSAHLICASSLRTPQLHSFTQRTFTQYLVWTGYHPRCPSCRCDSACVEFMPWCWPSTCSALSPLHFAYAVAAS